MTLRFGFANISGAFQSRDYAIWTAGSAVSLVGMWAQRIGVGWLAWELTHSSFWVAVVAFADLFPTVFVSPIAGMVGDRVDRLRVIWWAQFLGLASSAALLAMMLAGLETIGLLVGLVFIHGLSVGLKQPSRMAILRSLVAPGHLPTAVAISAVVFNTARFIGPAVAGAVILLHGIAAVFVLGVLGSAVLLVAIAAIDRNGSRETVKPRQDGGMLAEMAAGLRYAVRHGGVGPILLLQVAFGLSLRGYIELLPGFSARVLGMGADGLAALTASVGAGAIFAGIWLAQRPGTDGLTRIVIGGTAAAALTLAALAFADTPTLAYGLVAANGFALTANAVAAQTLVQRVTPEHLLARVLAIYGVIFRAGPAVSAIGLGAAADAFGFRWPLFGAALLSLAIVLIVARRFRAIRASLEDVPPPEAGEATGGEPARIG